MDASLLCSQLPAHAQGVLGSKTPKVTPAQPTGFSDVAPYLSAEGDLLHYYDTRDTVASIEGVLKMMGDLVGKKDDPNFLLGMKVMTVFYEESGIKSLAAIGSSSVPRGKQLYFNRSYIRRLPGNIQPGFLWNTFGEKSSRLPGIDLLPANTGFAAFANLNLPWIDSAVTRITSKFSDAAQGPEKFKAGLAQVGVKWEEALASLDNEIGFVLALDPKNSLTIPAPTGALKFPYPSGGLIVRIKNDYIFKKIVEFAGQGGVKETESGGVRMISQEIPHPMFPDLAPTAAVFDHYLVLSASREFPLQVASALLGKTAGVLKGEDFKTLGQDVPLEGSGFSYVSPRFSDAIGQVFEQSMETVQKSTPSPALFRQLSKVFTTAIVPQPSFTVIQRNGADWLTTSNGAQGSSMGASANVGTLGLLSAIAVPNFIRARTRSQATNILNEARMLDAAVDQYAIENNLAGDAPVEFKDVAQYLKPGTHLVQSGGMDLFERPYILKTIDGGIRINPETVKQLDPSVVPPDFFKPYVD